MNIEVKQWYKTVILFVYSSYGTNKKLSSLWQYIYQGIWASIKTRVHKIAMKVLLKKIL